MHCLVCLQNRFDIGHKSPPPFLPVISKGVKHLQCLALTNMPRAQRQDLELWATLTIQIGCNLSAPATQKENFYKGLMILMNPKNYQDGSNVRKLVTRLRRELQHAVQRATQTTHDIQTSGPTSTTTAPSTGNNHPNTLNHAVSSQTMTSTIRTANQTWPSPWPLPTNAQTTNPTTHDTTTVLPTDNNHFKTHNHTAPPITAKHKAPPPPLNDMVSSTPPRVTHYHDPQ